ncbi:hypothetical protein I5907_00020 [Panacibacter sp. DH6]|uniref:Uncharacterized protein n=1 Tax=Panacibacter microcysteis TaxID=2793269 RepID=A0A931E434_9BACT|nr:hypothetical protein [Panacibacter microcysteis]MBG9374603.1 hypothetical protein [Panacibacter microcysteis]
MTPKQIERAKKKIADIKRTLSSEKRKFGCYDDSRGLRYLPTKYFIQLGDYTDGLTYLKWFDKNFPDDAGFPEFLFEQTIIFFKCGKLNIAEQKAFQTFCSNPYWFDKFFGRHISPHDMWHSSSLTRPEYTDALDYSSSQPDLSDFAVWLDSFSSTDDFINRSNKYVDIYKRLKTETDKEMRHYLVRQSFQLEQGE